MGRSGQGPKFDIAARACRAGAATLIAGAMVLGSAASAGAQHGNPPPPAPAPAPPSQILGVSVSLAAVILPNGGLCVVSGIQACTQQVGGTVKVGVGFAITGTTLPTTSTVISLTSSKPTVLPVPANVTVPAGSTSTSFDTVAGPDCGNATITASLTDSFGVVSGSGPGGSIAVVPPGCRVLAPAPPSPPPPAPGPPTITSFTPTNGPIGTAVTITGTNLASVTQVGFNSFGTTFRALSATTIVAVVPSASATGLIEVINNAFGANTGFSSTAFTVTASAPPAPPPPPPPPVVSSITITRSELNAGQLRLEGTGAKPNAPLTVNGQALGTADATGAFRLQTTGFSAPGCTATVSDGTSSATAPLAGC